MISLCTTTKRIPVGAKVARASVALAVVIGGGGGIHAALAQSAGNVTVEVGECVNLLSPEDRLACYERHVEAARTAPTAPPDARSESAGDTAASAAPLDNATEPQEFVATVTALRQTVPNSHVITLDNGQVWRQTYAEWYPLQPGQKVRIHPTRWGGAFRLTTDELEGFIQVKRVR
jgi:hypothetical protein